MKTSKDAYDKIKTKLTELQAAVLAAARKRGTFTDKELRSDFPHLAYATAPTRRGELVKLGFIRATNEKREKYTVWECCEPVEEQLGLFGSTQITHFYGDGENGH
jgi:hypothetical protein